MRFIEKYDYLVKKYPELPVFDDCSHRITYKELDKRSSKIYARLKKLGITHEDFVTILLPRSVDIPAAIIGVIKSGAAFVIMEDTYPSGRVAYINENVGSKLVLDKKLLMDIYSSEEELPGYEKTDIHDAAYAVYTSGSTGNPKGVLHEYGNIDQLLDNGPETPGYSIGIFAPANFIVFTMFIFRYMPRAYTIWIIPANTVRDQNGFEKFILENELDSVFMPPSYIRLYKNPSPFLKEIFTGGESANGLYYPGGKPAIVNVYGMSEAGFFVLENLLEKRYDIAPVGKPMLDDIFCHLIDEEGNLVEGEGEGELCFTNSFTRGYINLPEKTAEVFVDGVYHTRDIARRDREGRYYIVGRIDDMIKINGNRVEPGEIEAVIKRLTGLRSVVAKGFDTGGRQFVCLYYLRKEADELGVIKEGELVFDRKKLSEMLPQYMIPSYYICLDEFPLNANNKIAKKLLEAPDISTFKKEYQAPQNKEEEFFCAAFEKVLELEQVGRDDDFFLLGGDSIRAIRLVSECDGYDISSKDLYLYRTPGMLAKNVSRSSAKANEFCDRMKEGYRDENLSGFPFYQPFLNNVTADTYIQFKEDIDIPRLGRSLDKLMLRYPFFCQHIEAENGRLYYVRDAAPGRIYSSDEDAGHISSPCLICAGKKLVIRIPHAFTDGFGMRLFTSALLEEYGRNGDENESVTPRYVPGQYYDFLAEERNRYVNCIPDAYRNLGDAYRLPEAGPDKKQVFRYTALLDPKNLTGYFDQGFEEDKRLSAIGGIYSIAAAAAMAEAVRNVHGSAGKITCRCPVNLRSILGHGDSLKNMSLCQATFTLAAGETALKEDIEAAASVLKPDIIGWQIARIEELKPGAGKMEEADAEVFNNLFNPTFLLTNVMTAGANALPDFVESVDMQVISDIPLLVTLGNEGEKIRVTFIQQFESREYFDTFCQKTGV